MGLPEAPSVQKVEKKPGLDRVKLESFSQLLFNDRGGGPSTVETTDFGVREILFGRHTMTVRYFNCLSRLTTKHIDFSARRHHMYIANHSEQKLVLSKRYLYARNDHSRKLNWRGVNPFHCSFRPRSKCFFFHDKTHSSRDCSDNLNWHGVNPVPGHCCGNPVE